MLKKVVVVIASILGLVTAIVAVSPYSFQDSGVLVYDYFTKPENAVPFEKLGDPDFDIAELENKYVILDFWASWCKPCREQFPAYDEIYSNLRDRDVVVVGVNVHDEPEKAQAFLKEVNVSFPIAYDTNLGLNNALGVKVYPTTFLLNKDHQVVEKFSGFGTNKGNHQRLLSALEKLGLES